MVEESGGRGAWRAEWVVVAGCGCGACVGEWCAAVADAVWGDGARRWPPRVGGWRVHDGDGVWWMVVRGWQERWAGLKHGVVWRGARWRLGTRMWHSCDKASLENMRRRD